jgi:hypothetical protein
MNPRLIPWLREQMAADETAIHQALTARFNEALPEVGRAVHEIITTDSFDPGLLTAGENRIGRFITALEELVRLYETGPMWTQHGLNVAIHIMATVYRDRDGYEQAVQDR